MKRSTFLCATLCMKLYFYAECMVSVAGLSLWLIGTVHTEPEKVISWVAAR